jgi:hypothetical protein
MRSPPRTTGALPGARPVGNGTGAMAQDHGDPHTRGGRQLSYTSKFVSSRRILCTTITTERSGPEMCTRPTSGAWLVPVAATPPGRPACLALPVWSRRGRPTRPVPRAH